MFSPVSWSVLAFSALLAHGGGAQSAPASPDPKAACESGDGLSCFEVALAYQDAGTDPARAVLYYDKACALGSSGGCIAASNMYAGGQGVPADAGRAFAAARRGCDAVPRPSAARDYPRVLSCYNLGLKYEKGTGVPADPAAAAKAYERSFSAAAAFCQEGDAESCYVAGMSHALGRGTPKDTRRARAVFEKACAAGQKASCEAIRP